MSLVKNWMKKSKWGVACYLIAQNLLNRLRQRIDRLEDDYGSTHRSFSLEQSIEYINSVFFDYLEYAQLKPESLAGKEILEIGYGDNLGVALRFISAGAKKVVCIDRFRSVRNPQQEISIYKSLREKLNEAEKKNFDRAISFHGNRISISSEILRVEHGVAIDDTGVAEKFGKFDLIISRAVLEHVWNLDLAFENMKRMLRPVGHLIHKIDFRDHGLFTGCGYHPLTFLTFGERLYRSMTSHSGGPNRIFRPYYSAKMKALGFENSKIYITQFLGGIAGGIVQKDFPDSSRHLVREIRDQVQAPIPDDELMIAGIFLIAHSDF